MNDRIDKARQGYRLKFGAMTELGDWTIDGDNRLRLNGREMCDDGEPLQHRRRRLFADEHGISDVCEVSLFAQWATSYVRCSVHELNGDAHPRSNDPSDKNDCSMRWRTDAGIYAAKMEALAKSWGFDHLDFGVGLYPTLQKTESQTTGTVYFPYPTN